MIYCSFCCIYVWLDPGTYMIAQFMFFYKPGVTDTQEISPHKDTSMSNMCHGGGMAKGWCYAHIVWSRSSLHMRHDMELCDQNGEDQEKAWLDGPVAMEKGKSRLWSEGPRGDEAWEDLEPMDRGNGKERARSRSMNQRGHVIIWSGSYHSRKIKPSVDS